MRPLMISWLYQENSFDERKRLQKIEAIKPKNFSVIVEQQQKERLQIA
jgi:hypothetical protein